MFGRHRSNEVVCPHCGAKQLEPRGVISTYCRTCSGHFSPGTQATAIVVSPAQIVSASVSRKTRDRRVACHACRHIQRAHHGVLEAPCRRCGSIMSYREVEISAHSTREVSTHGRLWVTRKGFLNSTRVQCASAQIDGRISGRVQCSGLLRLGGADQCKAQIHTDSLLVDRGANIQLAYTAMIGDGVIRGRVVGDIVCTGSLRIAKHGILLGEVETRGLTVDRGGIYSGDVRVGSFVNTEAPVDVGESRRRSDGMWLPGFAFCAA